jgi:hypothetical protein
VDDPQLNAEYHLTTFALTAVGYSGRAEAREILEAAAPTEAKKIARLGPGIVNAQFALDYIDQHGHEAFFKLSVSGARRNGS